MEEPDNHATVVMLDGTVFGAHCVKLARCFDFVWSYRAKEAFSSCRIWAEDDDTVKDVYDYRRWNQPFWYYSAAKFAQAAGITVQEVYKHSRKWRELNLIDDAHDGCELMISSEAIEWLKWKNENDNLNH